MGDEGASGAASGLATDVLVDFAWSDGAPWIPQHFGVPLPPTTPGGMNWATHVVWEEFFPHPATKNVRGGVREMGTVYGVAWDQRRQAVYTSSYFRRDGFEGPYGLGAIFREDELWLDVANDVGLQVEFPLVCDVDGDLVADERCVNDVGFVGLGDLEISDDGNTLFTVNLATQEIVAIPILPNGAADVAGVKVFQAPEPTACNVDNPGGFSRTRAPFALGYHEEQLYVGVTCTDNIDGPWGIPSIPNSAGPHGFVFSFDPDNPVAAPGYVQKVAQDLTHGRAHNNLFYNNFGGGFFPGWDGWCMGSTQTTGAVRPSFTIAMAMVFLMKIPL